MSAILGRRYTGPERAAIILLALGPEFGRELWRMLDEEEIRTVSVAMAHLGKVDGDIIDQTVIDFSAQIGQPTVTGDKDQTRRLLMQFLQRDRVDVIMEEIGSLGDRSMWHRLSQTHEFVLASYVKNELPATAAIILSRLSPQHAAKVLGALPKEFAVSVLDRMLTSDSIQRQVLEEVEETIRKDFANLMQKNASNQSLERVTEIVGHIESPLDRELLADLEVANPEATSRVRSRMFTFEDLAKLDNRSLQFVTSRVEREILARALKGSGDSLKRRFFATMSPRAAESFMDAIASLRPLRLREVHDAQNTVVSVAKALEAENVLVLSKKSDDPLVY